MDAWEMRDLTPKYLLVKPALEAVKDGPMIGQICVHRLVKFKVEDDFPWPILCDQVAQCG
jgi:hypothetical protein